MVEYKIVESPLLLESTEKLLNSMSKDGWRLITVDESDLLYLERKIGS